MKVVLDKSLSYTLYVALIDRLLAEGKTTGENQSEAMFNYGKLNRQRMNRIEKTAMLRDEVGDVAAQIERPQIWLIITEGWCGDAAQNIPLIEKIAAASGKIETRYVLRDENLELMDRYLTNNARSIPKLIAFDAETLEELGVWGPRPQVAMDLFLDQRAQGIEKSVISENIQRWYIADKNQSIQTEFAKLIGEWSNRKSNAALR